MSRRAKLEQESGFGVAVDGTEKGERVGRNAFRTMTLTSEAV